MCVSVCVSEFVCVCEQQAGLSWGVQMAGGESPSLIPEPGYNTPLYAHTHTHTHTKSVPRLNCVHDPTLSLSTFPLRGIIHTPLCRPQFSTDASTHPDCWIFDANSLSVYLGKHSLLKDDFQDKMCVNGLGGYCYKWTLTCRKPNTETCLCSLEWHDTSLMVTIQMHVWWAQTTMPRPLFLCRR